MSFIVSVDQAGQLGLELNAVDLLNTVYGRATGTSQIAGEALVTTTSINSLISVVNAGGSTLTITQFAGGPTPVAASVVIEQLR